MIRIMPFIPFTINEQLLIIMEEKIIGDFVEVINTCYYITCLQSTVQVPFKILSILQLMK